MDIYAYTLLAEVEDFFDASKLIQVAMAYKDSRSGKWYHHRNKRPATSLFNRATVVPVSATEFMLQRFRRTFAIIEKTDDGASWRYYAGTSKESANQIILLVEGHPEVDLYHANPGMRVEQVKLENGKLLTTVHNISLINERPWQEAQKNVDIDSIGCMWYVRGAQGLHHRQGGYIANGNIVDLNRGSGRVEFCKVTNDPDLPSTTDFKGTSDLGKLNADYVWSEADQLDSDREFLSLTLYHGVKQTITPFALPLTTLL